MSDGLIAAQTMQPWPSAGPSSPAQSPVHPVRAHNSLHCITKRVMTARLYMLCMKAALLAQLRLEQLQPKPAHELADHDGFWEREESCRRDAQEFRLKVAMKPDPDYYALLNLDWDASPADVEVAYSLALERSKRRLTRCFAFLTHFTAERIQSAYLTLSDPELRDEYDKYLKDLCVWPCISPMA
jgi:hypothetical protein